MGYKSRQKQTQVFPFQDINYSFSKTWEIIDIVTGYKMRMKKQETHKDFPCQDINDPSPIAIRILLLKYT